MRNMVSVICFTLLLLPYTNGFSEKKMRIVGADNCGDFLAACDKSKLHADRQLQTWWAMGFISAASGAFDTPIQDFDDNGTKYSLIKYCRENPLKRTYDGAMLIYLKLAHE